MRYERGPNPPNHNTATHACMHACHRAGRAKYAADPPQQPPAIGATASRPGWGVPQDHATAPSPAGPWLPGTAGAGIEVPRPAHAHACTCFTWRPCIVAAHARVCVCGGGGCVCWCEGERVNVDADCQQRLHARTAPPRAGRRTCPGMRSCARALLAILRVSPQALPASSDRRQRSRVDAGRGEERSQGPWAHVRPMYGLFPSCHATLRHAMPCGLTMRMRFMVASSHGPLNGGPPTSIS